MDTKRYILYDRLALEEELTKGQVKLSIRFAVRSLLKRNLHTSLTIRTT